MKISILSDNRVKKRGLFAEHGLSILIEHESKQILFDTGQSDIFYHNAMRMGADLTKTDYVVLSHGHYDHCSGLIHLPQTKDFPLVYAHKDLFAKRYAINSDGKTYREIGIPWSLHDYEHIKSKMIFTEKGIQIAPSITLCASIPSTVDFEEIPKGFYRKSKNNMTMDLLNDEQMLILARENGLAVFLGCCHPGVVNCLKYAQKLFPGKKIDLLLAGMHLENASPLRIQMTIQYMMDINIKKVVPLHCTGISAICEMKRFLANRCDILCAGDSLYI